MSPPPLVGNQLASRATAGLFFCVRPARVFLRRNAQKRKRHVALRRRLLAGARSVFSAYGSLIYNIGIARLPPCEPARAGARAPFHENVRCTAGGGMPRNFRRRRGEQGQKRNCHGSNSSVLHRSSRCRARRRRRRRPLLPRRAEGSDRCGHSPAQPRLRRGPHDDRQRQT